ncbi:zinc-ribbon domain-containing protein [Candidatus Pacearchaeota archaeon]|nr:zinc-ribbon domain-containing protein [Candidatus Pacearchaeota archaeon]
MAKKTSGGCWDLSDQLDSDAVASAFSRLVSGGKAGYKAVIERKKEVPICKKCGKELEGIEKFCPECGEKTEWQKKKEEPVILLTREELEKKFKSGEKKEHEVLAYLRDELKIQENTAFELIKKWEKETREPEKTGDIDLNQFNG